MKKFCLAILLILFSKMGAMAMIPPKYMLENINKSQIKTPAVVKKVKTIQNRYGNRTQLVYLSGLYFNEGKNFTAICHNYKKRFLLKSYPIVGIRLYNPKVNDRVFVTIENDGGEITSLIYMDENFEKKLQTEYKNIKYDCTGAYFEN